MLILGVDTSGKNGNIALVRFEGATADQKAFNREDREERPQSAQIMLSHTHEVVPLEGGTFSAQLIPQISALLQKHSLNKQQIDAFAVVTGPGSFTGLRVGLAAIKALAEILQKPIAAVSLLEALACAAETSGRVIATIDAGRGEIYTGTYDLQGGRASCVAEQLLTTNELLALAAGRRIVTSDSKLAETLRDVNATVQITPYPKADLVARVGFQKLQAGERVTPEALDATYIRRSDAEIKFGGQFR